MPSRTTAVKRDGRLAPIITTIDVRARVARAVLDIPSARADGRCHGTRRRDFVAWSDDRCGCGRRRMLRVFPLETPQQGLKRRRFVTPLSRSTVIDCSSPGVIVVVVGEILRHAVNRTRARIYGACQNER
jgi:hypothetical protein